MLVSHRNHHDQHKVFQVAHESRDCIQSIRIIFSGFFFVLTQGEKKREGNELWQWNMKISIITQPYKLCTKQ